MRPLGALAAAVQSNAATHNIGWNAPRLVSLGHDHDQGNSCEKDAQAYRHHPSGSESRVVELTVLRL